MVLHLWLDLIYTRRRRTAHEPRYSRYTHTIHLPRSVQDGRAPRMCNSDDRARSYEANIKQAQPAIETQRGTCRVSPLHSMMARLITAPPPGSPCVSDSAYTAFRDYSAQLFALARKRCLRRALPSMALADLDHSRALNCGRRRESHRKSWAPAEDGGERNNTQSDEQQGQIESKECQALSEGCALKDGSVADAGGGPCSRYPRCRSLRHATPALRVRVDKLVQGGVDALRRA